MTTTFPIRLNENGRAHVEAELARLNIDWDTGATCAEIEETISFGDLVQGDGDVMYHEISNISAGISSYGVFATIEIFADQHVDFEAVD